MRYFFAIFMPFMAFLTMGRPFSAFVCLCLQCTLFLWIPAMWWAILSTHGYNTEKSLLKALNKQENNKSI